MQEIAPLRNQTPETKPWEGSITKKPWEYDITVIIPVIDTWEPLSLVIQLLKLQTNKPYIIIIDTGSLPDNYKKIEEFRDESTEVHSLKLNSVQHPSDFVSMACDLGAALCRTEYMFYTHSDCFLMKRTVLEEFLNLCKQGNPAVGYQITERRHEGWEKMFGHSALILETKFYIENRLQWNLKSFDYMFSTGHHKPDITRPNFPDTETQLNILYQDINIKPLLIGGEKNFKRNINEHFDHVRTFASGLLYSPQYYSKCREWMISAMEDARKRIAEWNS